MDMGLSKLWELVMDREAWHTTLGVESLWGLWGRKESDTTERLNWTELNWCFNMLTNMEQQEDGCIFLRSNYFKNKKKNQCETINLAK